MEVFTQNTHHNRENKGKSGPKEIKFKSSLKENTMSH